MKATVSPPAQHNQPDPLEILKYWLTTPCQNQMLCFRSKEELSLYANDFSFVSVHLNCIIYADNMGIVPKHNDLRLSEVLLKTHVDLQTLMTETCLTLIFSPVSHINEVDTIISALGPMDILAFTETWLSRDNVDLCSLGRYNHFHYVCLVERGGVSLFLNSNINAEYIQPLSDIMSPAVKSVFISTKIPHFHPGLSNTTVGVIFWPLNYPVVLFTELFSNLKILSSLGKPLFLFGDFKFWSQDLPWG